MKNNQPVTSIEYVLLETESIVSKTDLKGVITYVNQDFLHTSGFTEAELIGASHNIVRHPDMPVEAFADLWVSMKAQRPWTGMVKNRCKNGDFYWVRANATPIFENGQCVGYMSVRSKPSRADIDAHEHVYSLFRNGQAGGLKIRDGKAVKEGLFSKLNLLKNTSIKFRVVTSLTLMSILMLIIGGAGLYGMAKSKESLAVEYENGVVPMAKIANIQQLMLTNRLHIMNALAINTPESIAENTQAVEKNIDKISKIWSVFTANPRITSDDMQLNNQYAADRNNFVADGLRAAVATLRANDIESTHSLLIKKVNPLYEIAAADAKKILDRYVSDAKIEHGGAVLRYEQSRVQAIAIITVGLLLALWAMLTVWFGVLRPIQKVVGLLHNVAQGKYNNDIVVGRRDEIGGLMDTIKAMQIRMGFDTADAYRMANENLRIRIGLDNVSTSVMISDIDRNIIYMNNAVVDLMQTAEADIRSAIPNFNASKLMGASIDAFHKKPEHQKTMLASLNASHHTEIVVGGRTFALTANPVINDRGVRLGAALEWKDRTAEVAVEKEVANIVDASVSGDFTQRINMQGKDGFFKQLGAGINQLMETSDTGLQEVVRMLGSLARGDLTDRITNEYSGTFGQLKDDSNATSDQLKETIGQIKDATDTINTAAKEIAAGNSDLSQRTEEQASSLEETASSMEELTSTVKQNAENAKQANLLAIGASDVAGKGGAVVNQVVTTMDSINESSRKIVDIISVIDGIAFQTNILALNAAVEAARAGEQGRGFAVVAAEVRNLAQRSAGAAKEIKTLIGDSVEKVEGGSKLVAQAGQTMDEIVSSIRRVTDIMSEITAASVEQSSGIEQVNLAITQMDEVTQQNAALVEEAAAAAESLEEQAQNLSVSVATFKMDGAMSQPARKALPVKKNSSAPLSRPPVRKPTPKASGDEGDWAEF